MGFLAIIGVVWFGYAGYLTYKEKVGDTVKIDDFTTNLKWPVDTFNAIKTKYTKK